MTNVRAKKKNVTNIFIREQTFRNIRQGILSSLRGECCRRYVGLESSLAASRYPISIKRYRLCRTKVWKYRQSLSPIVRRKAGTRARAGRTRHESPLPRFPRAHPRFRARGPPIRRFLLTEGRRCIFQNTSR